MKWVGKKTHLASKMGKKWVNVVIYQNLPNCLTPQPRRRFKSYKSKKKKKKKLLCAYIILIKLLPKESGI
jgi:hypothetical protein